MPWAEWNSDFPGTYSMMMYNMPSTSPKSYTPIRLGWFSFAMALASASKMVRNASSVLNSRGRILMATGRSNERCTAR